MRFAVLGLSLWVFVSSATYCRAADAEKPAESWYVRPIPTDEQTLNLLDDLGANSVGFRFHLPPDMKLTVTILAKDEKGERIKELSGVHELTPRRKATPFDTSVRLVRMDPGKFTENYQGKVRWVIHVGSSAHETWQPNRYTATGKRDSWWQGNAFEGPKQGKDYLLWRIKAYPKELRRFDPDSPAMFSVQIHFRYEPMQPGDLYGARLELYNTAAEQEYDRVVEDPREHASSQQK
ncbi:MAG TPA: hypothetical protein VMV10_11965 [Pirellulales bacterium]|nr:hypothetical protein [Pirellulales bacterium]